MNSQIVQSLQSIPLCVGNQLSEEIYELEK